MELLGYDEEYDDDGVCLQNGIFRIPKTEQNIVPSFVLVPNPANDKVLVKFNTVIDGNCKLRIKNTVGSEIMVKDILSGNESEIDIKSFAPGIYLVEVSQNGAWSLVKKLTVIR